MLSPLFLVLFSHFIESLEYEPFYLRRHHVANPIAEKRKIRGIFWLHLDFKILKFQNHRFFWQTQSRSMGHKSLRLLGLGQKSLAQSRDFELWDSISWVKNPWYWQSRPMSIPGLEWQIESEFKFTKSIFFTNVTKLF